jgi:hypothetical protein
MSKLYFRVDPDERVTLYRRIFYNPEQAVARIPAGLRLDEEEQSLLRDEWLRRQFPIPLSAVMVRRIVRSHREEQQFTAAVTDVGEEQANG